jgi:hypothetical protein
MAGWRHAVELAMSGEDIRRLTEISRSRSERASRAERAQMLLALRPNEKTPPRLPTRRGSKPSEGTQPKATISDGTVKREKPNSN